MIDKKIILASSSPRRKELLRRYIESFDILIPEVDETLYNDEAPISYVNRLAKLKAKTIACQINYDALIIAADTIVVLNDTIYNKPIDYNDAKETITNLMGNTHKVITSAYIIDKSIDTKVDNDIVITETSHVKFIDYDKDILDYYLSTNEYHDRAGSYAIQGKGAILVDSITGDYDNIVGLPIAKIIRELMRYNIYFL